MPVDNDFIGLIDVITGVGHALGQGAIIRHNEKALRHEIQTAHWIDAFPFLIHQLGDRPAAPRVLHGGHDGRRFIEQEITVSFLAQGTPVNEDPIRRRDLCSKFYHGLAIHGDPSLQDDLFTLPAACNARGCHHFLQPFNLYFRHLFMPRLVQTGYSFLMYRFFISSYVRRLFPFKDPIQKFFRQFRQRREGFKAKGHKKLFCRAI
ncbi:unknown [Acidaminococcus intestini CAG:325]|nr:unknown [Acidaminococcus intestini CAG:325]